MHRPLDAGSFEKLKARLVVGGNQQDKTLYEDLAAPTVSISSVFAVLSVAAVEHRNVAALDIGGAFLNASMETGAQVHMRLDKSMTRMLTGIEASYMREIASRSDSTKPCMAASIRPHSRMSTSPRPWRTWDMGATLTTVACTITLYAVSSAR
jgi:Reverse transcriptase (RNA-dependent DNA polymerase)